MIQLIHIFMVLCFLAKYDWDRFKDKGSTGRVSLVARVIIIILSALWLNVEVDNIYISLGVTTLFTWWVWDSLTGLLWYKNPFFTGNTKFIDRLFKKIPDFVMWFIKWFTLMCFLSVWYNKTQYM